MLTAGMAAATVGLHIKKSSAQSVRNHSTEVHLNACQPHQGCNQLQWAVLWGERFADVNIVDRVANGGDGIMVWAVGCYSRTGAFH